MRLENYDLWIKLCLSGLKGMNLEESYFAYYEDKLSLKKRNKTLRFREHRLRFHYMKNVEVSIQAIFFSLKPLILILTPLKLYKIVRKISKSEVI